MHISPHGVLKASLWLQAASLLVLTSLLADGNAWVGAIVTATGFCFVIIGIGAAHKQSLGYLYSYATLVGVWSFLAILHILLLSGLVTVPEELLDPVLVIGFKIFNNELDPTKIVIPALYAVQGIAWCVALVCIAYLRTAIAVAADPTSTHATATSVLRMVPVGYRHSAGLTRLSESRRCSMESSLKHMSDTSQHHRLDADYERGYPYPGFEKGRMECVTKKAGDGTNTISIPLNRSISQVVVTFRDGEACRIDGTGGHDNQINMSMEGFEPLGAVHSGESLSDMIFSAVLPDNPVVVMDRHPSSNNTRRRSIVTNHGGPDGYMQGPTQDEIVKDLALLLAKRSNQLAPAIKTSEVALSFEQVRQLELLQRQRQHQQMSLNRGILMKKDNENDEEQEQRDLHGPADPCVRPVPVVPARRSSIPHFQLINSLPRLVPSLEKIKEGDEQDMSVGQDSLDLVTDCNNNNGDSAPFDARQNYVPILQPNSSDSQHPFTQEHIMASTGPLMIRSPPPPSPVCEIDTSPSTISALRQSTPSPPAVPPPLPPSQARAKPSITSLQYWRQRAKDDSEDNQGVSPQPTTPASYLSKAFSKKKRQTLSGSTPGSPGGALAIPTIVLHPDEDDGEPARVLSDKEIEYLSMLPPTPLRALLQPWEEQDDEFEYGQEEAYAENAQQHTDFEYEEFYNHRQHYRQQQEGDQDGEYEDDCGGEGDSGHGPEELQEDIFDEDRLGGEGYDEEIDLVADVSIRNAGKREAVEDETFDPYALDVPINLEIDLQALTQVDAGASYGYI
ncbi:hypothetical protein BGW38_001683 [Lunasporangiospora selenospora]|uniref:Uncharacterized protein n=1 Tax=Lunasporangiospora selenospora TaxID=979761 RepID=A0A9P6FUA4_9FUNG|nr:hypothetical protein BGW38_001683 [Lunasporangiospora selenospora]